MRDVQMIFFHASIFLGFNDNLLVCISIQNQNGKVLLRIMRKNDEY